MRLATSLKKDKLAVNRSQAFWPETCPMSLRTRSNEEEVCARACLLCVCVCVCVCVYFKQLEGHAIDIPI